MVDVARAAGVSRQTVSNAVNAPQRVAPETLERVRREIDRLGFRPNTAARALRRSRSATLGLQIGPPDQRTLGTLFAAFLHELTVAARAADLRIVTFSAQSAHDPTADYEHLLALRAVDGFLLSDTRHDDPRARWLRAHAVPFASFGRVWDEPEIEAWVDVDGASGTAAAVRHVAEQGYGPIGFLGWPHGSPVGDDRRAGWQQATSALDRQPGGLESTAPEQVCAAAQAAGPLLDRLGRGSALICASDTLALGAWTALQERGWSAGADVALVGFDDSEIAASFGLTSLRQPLAAIAATMLALASGAPGRVLLQPAVVPRASTRPVPAPHAPLPTSHRNHGGSR